MSETQMNECARKVALKFIEQNFINGKDVKDVLASDNYETVDKVREIAQEMLWDAHEWIGDNK